MARNNETLSLSFTVPKKHVPVCSVLCESRVLFHVIHLSWSVQIPIPAFSKLCCDLQFILLSLFHNPSTPYYIYTFSAPSLPHILTLSLNRLLIICLKSKPSSHLLFPSRCCHGMTPHGLPEYSIMVNWLGRL